MNLISQLLRPAASAVALATLTVLLAACGGGSTSSDTGVASPNVATPAVASPVGPQTGAVASAPAGASHAAALAFGAVRGKPVVYWIHTEWCTTCKRIRPEWPAIVAEYGDAVQLILVDRDTAEGNAFARSHRINYQPGFVVLDAEGNVTYAGLGPYTPAEVRSLIAQAAQR